MEESDKKVGELKSACARDSGENVRVAPYQDSVCGVKAGSHGTGWPLGMRVLEWQIILPPRFCHFTIFRSATETSLARCCRGPDVEQEK